MHQGGEKASTENTRVDKVSLPCGVYTIFL